ncbi:MAG: UDP-N-acetylglucosamine 1-carboxyvinyltransferase [Candidatus Harrisonbacteria bacterium CG10_big_fil_rev_8_21_14_0_10_42_17]|uniref:UDP-N-acetylglucosamine 1-carboxyvinyltransferase n=1 Tax=Candidatus Harrisonbacteria bacterium CG10_big_fil_rev_8_21_14_0_10_42_17 TaxID=1974584 RepID=A0A2M6WIK1_9BACT|nr:MAG: UDP-N-acetylglucosamine 1-carboxyvinyltransferase [Candidatus Harrisonbacteria bacterium CG10_big_fil_rev_8_21_14_0_10_42_17]
MQKAETSSHIALESLSITGGIPLTGTIVLGGAKNSTPKLMVAALLSAEPSLIHNVPDIEDVHIVTNLIEAMGGSVKRVGPKSLEISASSLHLIDQETMYSVAGTSRIPVLFAGPLLGRIQEAVIPMLGGCNIGLRPVDFHVAALTDMGAYFVEVDKGMHATTQGLQGTKIYLPYPSVGATEQVLLAAVLAQGITELSNAAVEPEIIDFIAVLQKMGAIISVDTDRVITIKGVSLLHGFEHSVIPDRIEAASWASVALATSGEIFVRHARQLDMTTFLNIFRQIGGDFTVQEDGIVFRRVGDLRPVVLETDVHPGFMTDWQQPLVVALTQADGVSIVHETVYENRFGYIKALQDMGAKIQLHRECLGGKPCRFGQRNHLHSALISGATPLHSAEITIPDLRAGFSYVVAALAAEGTSIIHNARTLRRGYEHFVSKLQALGAQAVEQ